MEAVLLLVLPICHGPDHRALRQRGAGIGDDDPGLALRIGAHPDAVPLEQVGHQSGRVAHGWEVERTGASCRDANTAGVNGLGAAAKGAGTGPARTSRTVLSCRASTSHSSHCSFRRLPSRTVVVMGRRVRQKAGNCGWGIGRGVRPGCWG